jgi:hypothetical protein
MKARVIATGEIVDAILTERETIRGERVWMTDDGRLIEDSRLDFNVTDEPDYWERMKHQYAGMAMQAQMAPNCLDSPEGVACTAYAYAHALVQKLKEKEERK